MQPLSSQATVQIGFSLSVVHRKAKEETVSVGRGSKPLLSKSQEGLSSPQEAKSLASQTTRPPTFTTRWSVFPYFRTSRLSTALSRSNVSRALTTLAT